MPKKPVAPGVKAPKEEHKKHTDEFLKLEEHKQPKSGIYSKSGEAKP